MSLLATGLLAACAASKPTPTPPTPTPPPPVEAPIANVAEEPPPVVEPPPVEYPPPPRRGETFEVVEVAPDDAYYSTRHEYIGLVCTASEAFQDNGEYFYGGPALCNNGDEPYFFRVRVAVSGSAGVISEPTSYGGTLAMGTKFTITGIDSTDAYHDDAAKIIGLSCTASSDMHERSESPGWYGGPADCSDGSDYYFYSASVSISGASGTKVTGTGVMGVTGGSTTGGAADPDRDYDGIADSRDSCPDAAEDRDMDKDYDGCPDY